MLNEPETLPAIPESSDPGRLLVRYDEAKRAITECRTLAGCKEWSDKAAALRAYAALAKDDSLRLAALKFQAYAERRAGELLKEVEPARGANQNIQDGAVPKVTRESAAKDAGLSERQRKTALRLASIPEKDFEAAVESETPPTITELAMRGTVTRAVPDPAPDVSAADPAAVARAHRELREFAAFCGVHDPVAIAHEAGDADMLRGQVETISHWLDRFVVNLPADVGDAT